MRDFAKIMRDFVIVMGGRFKTPTVIWKKVVTSQLLEMLS